MNEDSDGAEESGKLDVARRVGLEISERLAFLADVGLDYLSLNRPSATLSRRRGPAHSPGHPDRLFHAGGSLHP